MSSVRNVSTWLSVSSLRKLRGCICSLDVYVSDSAVETKSGALCSFFLKRYGLINRIPFENILSVDLKQSQKIELIFNENQYIERKLNIYTDSANQLVELIDQKMRS